MNKQQEKLKSEGHRYDVRDYTKERRKWLEKLSLDDFAKWCETHPEEKVLAELKAIQAKKRKRKAA